MEVDAAIQDERAVNLISTQLGAAAGGFFRHKTNELGEALLQYFFGVLRNLLVGRQQAPHDPLDVSDGEEAVLLAALAARGRRGLGAHRCRV